MLDRVADHLRNRMQVELLADILAMHLGGLGTDIQPLRDFLGGHALANQAQYFTLAPGKSRRCHVPDCGRTSA